MGSNTGPLTDSGESVMRIGRNTGQLTDSGGQLTDSGESVMRIGGNTGPLTDSGESVMRILITNVFELVEVNSTNWWCFIACVTQCSIDSLISSHILSLPRLSLFG